MQAVIFVGIQGSGKSSFFKERFYSTHIRINGDMLKTMHREREFISTCLATQQPFVVDKVNARRDQRAGYIRDAKQCHFRVVGYYFRCKPNEAIGRNQQRAGKAKIPLVGILAAYKQLEAPTFDEGFDELYSVHLTPSGVFEVEPGMEANLTK